MQILLDLINGQNRLLTCVLLSGGIWRGWIGRAGRGLSKSSSRNSKRQREGGHEYGITHGIAPVLSKSVSETNLIKDSAPLNRSVVGSA
jgi:hypothetical protein